MRTNSRYIRECREIARSYGVGFYIMKRKKDGTRGYYNAETKNITVAYDVPLERFLSVFCHEMGHFFCHRDGKYPTWHKKPAKRDLDAAIRHYEGAVRTGLRAERYVDEVGRKMMKEWFPGIRFRRNYTTKKSLANLEKNLDMYRNHIKMLKMMKSLRDGIALEDKEVIALTKSITWKPVAARINTTKTHNEERV